MPKLPERASVHRGDAEACAHVRAPIQRALFGYTTRSGSSANIRSSVRTKRSSMPCSLTIEAIPFVKVSLAREGEVLQVLAKPLEDPREGFVAGHAGRYAERRVQQVQRHVAQENSLQLRQRDGSSLHATVLDVHPVEERQNVAKLEVRVEHVDRQIRGQVRNDARV